jgi:hypothetical protein
MLSETVVIGYDKISHRPPVSDKRNEYRKSGGEYTKMAKGTNAS